MAKVYYYDIERNISVNSSGEPDQNAPLLVYQSYEEWTFTLGKMVSGVFTAQDVSDATTWECSVFTDWTASLGAGALTAGFSGAVTEITVDGLSATPPSAGFLILTNGAGEQDSVFYTAYTSLNDVYTFTVSATLTYTYLENDVCSYETSPPSLRVLNANIDSTNASTGLIKPTLDADNPVFLSDLSGERTQAGFLQIKGFDGSSNRLYYMVYPVTLHGDGDPNLTSAPSPVTAYYTKTQSDARYAQLAGAVDVEITDATKGFILKDRTTATRYRLYIDNGIIGIESL